MDYFTATDHSSSDYGSNSNSSSVTKNNGAREKEIKGGGGKNKSKGVMRLSTDPQSVAARERRHRISDRFKILQSLVPGGTKMDTVSMLEEAIHYVKFLKTQIWLHQTMINFVDDDGDHHHHDLSSVSSSPMFQLPAHHHHPITGSLDHQLPHHLLHHQNNPQTCDFYTHNNFVSAASVQPPSPAFDIPLTDSGCFQDQDTMAMVNNIEAYMKYYS